MQAADYSLTLLLGMPGRIARLCLEPSAFQEGDAKAWQHLQALQKNR
jgi:hypothetical protein